MSKEDNIPPPSPNDPPLDDYGIELDRMLEICEKMTQHLYEKYVSENTKPNSTVEIKEIVSSLETILSITKNILNIDDVINSAMFAMSQGQIPFIMNDDDEDDEGEDLDEDDEDLDDED